MLFTWGPFHYTALHGHNQRPNIPNYLNHLDNWEYYVEKKEETIDKILRSKYSGHHKDLTFQHRLCANEPPGQSIIETFNVRADKKPYYDPNKLTIATVRNPFDWLISSYAYDFMECGKYSKITYPFQKADFVAESEKQKISAINYRNFKNWIKYTLTCKDKNEWLTKSQRRWPWPMHDKMFFSGFDDFGKCHIDLYLSYENISHCIKQVCDLANIPFVEMPKEKKKISHFKGNNLQNYKDYYKNWYDSDKISIVENAYSWDLKTFGYKSNGDGSPMECFILE